MFYLIGGTPRTGKTSLAKVLSKKLGIPWISTDTLESVVSQYIPEKELQRLFPKSAIRKETKQSNDIMYEKYSTQEIVDVYIKQAETLKQAIEVFLESEAQYNHSYILEGYHVTPSLVAKLKDNFEIQSVFLGREDKEDIHKSITMNTDSTNWVVSKTTNKETFDKIANMIVAFSERLKKEAQSYGQQYYPMDGDFELRMNEVSNYLK